MKTAYSFTVLRYVHDNVSGEYANVGIVVYVPELRLLKAQCTTHYGRLSKLFLKVDGDHLRSLFQYIQNQLNALGERLKDELPYDKPGGVIDLVTRVLPADDSSLQWSPPGGGLTESPESALAQLYPRFVTRYEERHHAESRSDDDIWRIYRQGLEEKAVIGNLRPKLIAAKDYEHTFQHAWKNQRWHVYEPVSFDLVEADSILDKANRWLGRAVNLQDAQESFKLHILLGEPRLEKMQTAFGKAENTLHKMPVEHEFVREHEAPAFARQLAEELAKHGTDT